MSVPLHRSNKHTHNEQITQLNRTKEIKKKQPTNGIDTEKKEKQNEEHTLASLLSPIEIAWQVYVHNIKKEENCWRASARLHLWVIYIFSSVRSRMRTISNIAFNDPTIHPSIHQSFVIHLSIYDVDRFEIYWSMWVIYTATSWPHINNQDDQFQWWHKLKGMPFIWNYVRSSSDIHSRVFPCTQCHFYGYGSSESLSLLSTITSQLQSLLPI